MLQLIFPKTLNFSIFSKSIYPFSFRGTIVGPWIYFLFGIFEGKLFMDYSKLILFIDQSLGGKTTQLLGLNYCQTNYFIINEKF